MTKLSIFEFRFVEPVYALFFLPDVYLIFSVALLFILGLYFSFRQRPYNFMSFVHLRAFLKLFLGVLVLAFLLLLNLLKFNFLYDESLGLAEIGLFFGLGFKFFYSSWTVWFKIILVVSFFFYLLIILPSLFFDLFFKLELFFFLSFSFFGILLFFSVADFMSFYLVLELSTFCFYILAAFKTRNIFSVEASIKYFILSSVSSGFFLFGLSFLYLLSGSVDFFSLKCFLMFSFSGPTAAYSNFLIMPLSFSLILILVALLFKVGAAPFHSWVPDVYDGSPTFVTFYFSSIAKVGTLGFLARVYWEILPLFEFSSHWALISFFCGFLSIFIGSLGAFFQARLKRWIAYSGIVHVGFMLFVLPVSKTLSIPIFFFYLSSYLLLVFTFFLILFSARGVTKYNLKIQTIYDLRFLFNSGYELTFFLILNLFSFAGLPPLLGFFAKLPIFYALISDYYYLYSFGILILSVLSTFYYLRLISFLFFDAVKPKVQPVHGRLSTSALFLLCLFSYFNFCGYLYFWLFWKVVLLV